MPGLLPLTNLNSNRSVDAVCLEQSIQNWPLAIFYQVFQAINTGLIQQYMSSHSSQTMPARHSG